MNSLLADVPVWKVCKLGVSSKILYLAGSAAGLNDDLAADPVIRNQILQVSVVPLVLRIHLNIHFVQYMVECIMIEYSQINSEYASCGICST